MAPTASYALIVTLHFQYSLDDHKAIYLESHSWQSRLFRDSTMSQLYWWLVMPAMLAAIAIVAGSFVTAIFAYGLIWIVNTLFARWIRARFYRKFYTDENVGVYLLPSRVELLADRLAFNSPYFIHEYLWSGFHSLRETPRYFHVYFSPTSSIGIPKSAFSSEAELEAFRREVNSHKALP